MMLLTGTSPVSACETIEETDAQLSTVSPASDVVSMVCMSPGLLTGSERTVVTSSGLMGYTAGDGAMSLTGTYAGSARDTMEETDALLSTVVPDSDAS